MDLFKPWSTLGVVWLLALTLCAALAQGCGSTNTSANEMDAAGSTDLHPVDAAADPTSVDAGSDATADSARPGDSGAGAGAGDAADAAQPQPSLGPPYPVVLAHGMFGFDELADQPAVPYWYHISGALESAGERVFITEVDPLNDSYHRGDQLLGQVIDIVQDTGYAKVNLIGHSQGGLDVRYVAHQRPDLVASAVTIASPNGGSPIADIVLQLVSHPKFQQLVDAVVRVVSQPLYDEAGDETSLFRSLRQFSEPGIAEFNRRITDQPGVYYASVAGRSGRSRGGLNCIANDSPPFIHKWDYYRDPVDPLLALPEAILSDGFDNRPNDGMVEVAAAMWGDFLGCIPADHFDEVGQLLGDAAGGDNPFDHLEFFVDLVTYLHAQGL